MHQLSKHTQHGTQPRAICKCDDGDGFTQKTPHSRYIEIIWSYLWCLVVVITRSFHVDYLIVVIYAHFKTRHIRRSRKNPGHQYLRLKLI